MIIHTVNIVCYNIQMFNSYLFFGILIDIEIEGEGGKSVINLILWISSQLNNDIKT